MNAAPAWANKLLRPALALIAGAALPLSLAPWFYWPVGVASCTLLALLLQRSNGKQAYWLSTLFGFAMFAVGASWVYVSIHVYGNASVPLALLLTGVFVSALAVIFALPFWLYGRFCQHSNLARLLGFPAVWVLSEWGMSWILTGFPWVFLGYGHLDTWLAGWAPVTGVWGISWIIAFCGATVALRKVAKGSRLYPAAIVASILFWLGGFGLNQINWTQSTEHSISVGLLQPNIAQQQRWDTAHLNKIISNNLKYNEVLWGNDLIIWPEAAIPQFKHRLEPLLAQLDASARQRGAGMIIGLPSFDFATDRYYNTVTTLGEASGEYRKQHLVPFGEYLPLDFLLRGLIDFFNLPMSEFASGSADQPLLMAQGHPIGTAICYEIAYPELVRQVSKEAELLLTVSNDTWFGDSLGPLQHLSMAQMRALENSKPLIRATNDGITALVDHRGNLTDTLPQFTSGMLSGKVTPRAGTTPFGILGSWPILLISFLSVIVVITLSRKQ